MEGSISTPSDSGATTTGPTSFSDASLTWTDAPSASTPSTDGTAAASASADATVQPAASATPDGTTPGTGEPPRERWNDILANARQKAAEEAVAPLAWAKSVDQQELSRVVDMARRASSDPIGYVQEFIKELQTHPEYGAQLRSLAARALAQRSQQPAQEQPPQTVNVQLEDGTIVPMPRDPAAWLAFHQKQWMQNVQQELQPFRQTHEQLQAERAAAVKQQEIHTYVSTTHQDVTTWPGMQDKANQVAVANELATMRLSSDDPREVTIAVNAAYRRAVLPTLNSRAEAKLLDSLQQKATASTSVNPGSTGSSSPRPVRTFADLPADAWR